MVMMNTIMAVSCKPFEYIPCRNLNISIYVSPLQNINTPDSNGRIIHVRLIVCSVQNHDEQNIYVTASRYLFPLTSWALMFEM